MRAPLKLRWSACSPRREPPCRKPARRRTALHCCASLFATLQDDDRVGYDTDVGRALADWLGVDHEWAYVRAATRISTLAEGGADVVVATMGHNTRRDAQARFIRPHYYRSQTIVVGPKASEVGGFEDLYGRSVCTTIGNYANSNIVSHYVA